MWPFQSREEKRMKWKIKANQALAQINQQVKKLEKDAQRFVGLAKEALKEGHMAQYQQAKKALMSTESKRKAMKQAALSFMIINQQNDQLLAMNRYAEGMQILTRSMNSLFRTEEIAKIQQELDSALQGAKSKEEQINLIMEQSSDMLLGSIESVGEGTQVTEAEIDRMIAADVAHEESRSLAGSLDDAVREIERLKKLGS